MSKKIEKEYREFAYVVSHDLNAPLRQIDSFTSLLMEDLGDRASKDQILYREMIHKAIHKAQISLEGLLAFSRLNTEEKEFIVVSLPSLFNEVLQELEDKIIAQEATIKVGELPQFVQGDYKTLKRAFYEILDNALKFQPPGQKPIININGHADKTITVICIEDNGIGIAEKDQQGIFTILRRLHTSDEYKGHGIGLSLAKKIAELHGGYMEVDSIKDKKTKFNFVIKEQRGSNGNE